MNNKWIKYLVETGEYRQIDPEELYSNANSRKTMRDFVISFQRMWENQFFQKRVLSDLMQIEVIPTYNSLDDYQKRDLYKVFKKEQVSQTADLIFNYTNRTRQAADRRNQYILYFRRNSAILDNDLFHKLEELLCVFINGTKNSSPRSFNYLLSDVFSWARVYKKIYSKHNIEQPKLPFLNKIPGNDQSNKTHNLIFFSKNYGQFNREDLEKIPLLREIRIGKFVGEGAYGKVYELEGTERVIKFFFDGVDLNKDIKRTERVLEQVYGGTASLEDMHYFDYGKLGKTGLLYIIMPKIVPLRKLKIYKENTDLIEGLVEALFLVGQYGTQKSFEDFSRDVLLSFTDGGVKITGKLGNEFVRSIIMAGFRATTQHGGTDFHTGNIGFLPQKPDIFFFFDM